MFADSLVANHNDTVLVPVRVRDFNNIIGVQGTLGFDETVADYITVEQFGVPGMSISNFGETMVNSGVLTFSWNALNTTVGETLADSAILFAVKYHVIGAGGAETDISFLNSPTPVEITDNTLSVLNPFLSGGHIEVLPDTSQTFSILIDTVVGLETQLVNVPIRAWAFNDIISMQGTFGFDNSVITYSTVTNFNMPYLSLSNFGTTQVNNGLLSFSWFDQDLSGDTYADSTILFELVFQVIGNPGDFGEVILNNDLTPIEIVELGNLPIPFVIDSGGVIIDTLGSFIGINGPTDVHYCAGDSIEISFETNQTLNPGNIYTLQLSDETGDFTSPTNIGTLASTLDSTTITGVIPKPITMGTGYKVRVNSSLPTLEGTPSLVNLTVEYFEDTIATQICFGDSVMIGGLWHSTPGFYGDTLATVNGCDSVIVTHLTLTTELVDTVFTTICQGDSVMLQGGWQTTSGWYVDSLTSQQGCDSLIRTNLTVNNVPVTNVNQSICVEDSIFLAGAWQNTIGVYTDTLNAANGCDSLVHTTVSFYPSDTLNLAQSICQGDSIMLGGAWQNSNGTYTDIYTSMFGCDSVVHTQLTVIPPVEIYDSVKVCFGDSLFVQGAWQTASGDYIDSLTAASGCDSLIYTNLVVRNLIADTTQTTLCFGDSLFVQGAWQLTTGIYTDSLVSVHGCDSLEVVDLTILNQITSSNAQTICDGDSLLIHGVYQSTAGVYIDTFTAVSGCDSIATFTLSIESHPLYPQAIQICVGDSSFLQGAWQTTSGVYLDTLSSALGCDSIIQTTLNVINTIQTPVSIEICAGDSLFLEGGWQTTSGVYSDTLTAVAGCDSIVVTTLTVPAPIVGVETMTICVGDSVLIGSNYQSVAGNYINVLMAANGCNSTVTVTLVVNPTYYIPTTAAICQGDSILLEGVYQMTSGVYLDTNLTVNGCDSIIETTLTVHPIVIENQTVQICQGDSALIHGSYENTAGLYMDTLTAATGCDSIANITLVVHPNYFVQTTAAICQGDSIMLEGAWQSSAGTYLDTIPTINGCDSIIETTLSINPTYFAQESVTICQGDSVLLEGAYQYSAGVYYDTTLTVNGCDSIVETTLTVNPAPEYFSTVEICAGDSVQIHGNYESVAGVYIHTSQTANGCDSISNVTLIVNPVPVTPSTVQICQGDSVLIHGNYESVAGNYLDTLTTVNGCDSILDVTLVVNPTYFVQDAASICAGDSLFLEGSWQTTSGVYLDTTATVSGCDSIVETTLTVNPAPIYYDDITICDGDSVLVNGEYLSVAGVYVDTLQTPAGCDSIVETTLNVTVIDNTVTNDSPTLTANYAGAQAYQWINCDSGHNIANATTQSHTFAANGSYQVLITDQGCSVYSDCETVDNVSLDDLNKNFVRIYPNPTSDEVTVEHELPDLEMRLLDVFGKEVMKRNVGTIFTISLRDYPTGIYFLVLGGNTYKIVKN